MSEGSAAGWPCGPGTFPHVTCDLQLGMPHSTSSWPPTEGHPGCSSVPLSFYLLSPCHVGPSQLGPTPPLPAVCPRLLIALRRRGTPRGWGPCPLATPPLPRALPTSWLWVSSPLGAAPAVISLTLTPHPKAGRCESHLTDTHAEAQSPGVGQGHAAARAGDWLQGLCV